MTPGPVPPSISLHRRVPSCQTQRPSPFILACWSVRSPSKSVDIFDAEKQQWSRAQLSVAREQLAGACTGNKVCIVGASLSSRAPRLLCPSLAFHLVECGTECVVRAACVPASPVALELQAPHMIRFVVRCG